MSPVPPDQEAAFRAFLQRETGFVVPERRWKFLASRFFDRLEGRGFPNIKHYLHYLETDPLGRNELEEIFVLLTVRKTSFFRNPASYQALIHEILPRLVRERKTRLPLCIWSAGCSTGEEPYSLGMVARTVQENHGLDSYILATDIVKEAISTARTGSYPESSLASVPPEFRRFLKREGGRLSIDPDVRALVEFTEHNLVHEAMPRSAIGHWDVIFCRNVFIYFSLEQAQAILRRFMSVIPPGGVLFLGHAEVFTELEDEFEVVFWGDTFYYRKRLDPRVAPVSSIPLPEPNPVSSNDDETPARPIPKPVEPPPRPKPPEERSKPRRTAWPPPSDKMRRLGSSTGPYAETRKIRRPKINSPSTETSRWDMRTRGETPTRAVPRPYASRDSGEHETRAFSRVWEDRRPRDLILQAERRLQAGDSESAARALRAATSRAPRWAKPRVMLARIYVDHGELDHARFELEAAVEAEPLDYGAHYMLGSVHARSGDHARAEVSLRRALYLEPDHIPARYDLAQSLRARDLTERACRELRSVLRSLRSLDPTRLLSLTQGMKIPIANLRETCEREIDDMGGSLLDSGVWRLPKPE